MTLQKASISISHTEYLEQICISSFGKKKHFNFSFIEWIFTKIWENECIIVYIIYIKGHQLNAEPAKYFLLTKTKYLEYI